MNNQNSNTKSEDNQLRKDNRLWLRIFLKAAIKDSNILKQGYWDVLFDYFTHI